MFVIPYVSKSERALSRAGSPKTAGSFVLCEDEVLRRLQIKTAAPGYSLSVDVPIFDWSHEMALDFW